jgi:aminopeptidase N
VLVSAVDVDPRRIADLSPEAAARRALMSMSMSLLATLDARHQARLMRCFEGAGTMTIRLAALNALSAQEGETFDRALAAFEDRWSASPLVMDKWFSVQAASIRSDLRERMDGLVRHPEFDLRNPNRVRALAATFAMSNPVAFHAADGWGYRFLTRVIRDVDPLNPALSARLTTSFETWRSYTAERRTHAEACLRELSAVQPSKNALDIIARALAEPDSLP